MQILTGLLGILVLGLVGCASSYEIVEIPKREADLYPLAQTKDGVTIAVDELTSPTRSQQYFGVDLFEEGIVPINIVVSNHSERQLLVSPSDILLLRGQQSVIDPVPLQTVTNLAKSNYGLLSSTEQQIDEHFEELTLQEIVLMPGQVYQGVLFFQATQPDKRRGRYFSVLSLFRHGALNLRVSTKDLDTRQRTHFGPFPISVH